MEQAKEGLGLARPTICRVSHQAACKGRRWEAWIRSLNSEASAVKIS